MLETSFVSFKYLSFHTSGFPVFDHTGLRRQLSQISEPGSPLLMWHFKDKEIPFPFLVYFKTKYLHSYRERLENSDLDIFALTGLSFCCWFSLPLSLLCNSNQELPVQPANRRYEWLCSQNSLTLFFSTLINLEVEKKRNWKLRFFFKVLTSKVNFWH